MSKITKYSKVRDAKTVKIAFFSGFIVTKNWFHVKSWNFHTVDHLPFQVVPRCPGEMGLFANSWSSSSLPVLAIHDPKIDFFPFPPEVHGVRPACNKNMKMKFGQKLKIDILEIMIFNKIQNFCPQIRPKINKLTF